MEVGAWGRDDGRGWMEQWRRWRKERATGLTEEDAGNDDDFFLETGQETLVSVDGGGCKGEYTR